MNIVVDIIIIIISSSSSSSISGFGGHMAISRCRSMSQSPGQILFKLTMIANPKFAVGISILSVVVTEIKVFPVFAALLPFPVSIVVA